MHAKLLTNPEQLGSGCSRTEETGADAQRMQGGMSDQGLGDVFATIED